MTGNWRELGLMLTAVSFLSVVAGAAPVDRKNKGPKRPRKPNPALVEIKDVEGLPRVLLIGDSISIGYTLPTRKLLHGKANLHRIPANGGDTDRGLQKIDQWLGKGKWDVIHFNWGLHDLKRIDGKTYQVPLQQYRENLTKLVGRLKKTGATLIWCSTTPVPEGVRPPRTNADAVAYNKVAAEIMAANQIAVDDLYSFVLPRMGDIQRPANVHFTRDGSISLAHQVAAAILNALKTR